MPGVQNCQVSRWIPAGDQLKIEAEASPFGNRAYLHHRAVFWHTGGRPPPSGTFIRQGVGCRFLARAQGRDNRSAYKEEQYEAEID
jgi:hypothetical protein